MLSYVLDVVRIFYIYMLTGQEATDTLTYNLDEGGALPQAKPPIKRCWEALT